MNSDKERDYLNNYQYNHFQSTINDPYKNLDIRRQCLVQTVTACHALNKENLAGTILQEKLKEYGEMVDENHKINNYGSSIKYLASNVDKSHCMQWKNELKVEDFTDLINNLQCCSNNAIPDNGIDILFQKNPKLLVNDTKISLNSNKNQFHFQKRSVENNINKNEIYVQNIQKNEPKENSSNQAVKRNNFAMFKTARDEFEVQNAKKHKLNQNSNQPQPNGGVKKSLGARRGVQGKFIPPVRAEPNEDGTLSLCRQNNSPSWDSEEIVDERLKNIDPKMIELIRSEIMDSGASISWDDIAGLEFAKTIIKEVVVWPLLRPDIFTGLRCPPKGILLFGPPGTGKTLIGKCIASQSQSTFFSISASSLTSKWIGDGEKMVRAMFAVARCHQPAVVFIDEIDSLLSQRSDTEHESSRRIKTEFLVQLDGAATGDEDRILVIGATNRPQELDEAARRRFVKRLYIPLPEKPARLEIIKRLMSNERHELSEENIIKVADLSKGYSGADMKSLCAEASLGPIRSLDISMIQNIQADQVRPITMQDFQSALNRVRASVSPRDLEQYVTWDQTYGAGGW